MKINALHRFGGKIIERANCREHGIFQEKILRLREPREGVFVMSEGCENHDLVVPFVRAVAFGEDVEEGDGDAVFRARVGENSVGEQLRGGGKTSVTSGARRIFQIAVEFGSEALKDLREIVVHVDVSCSKSAAKVRDWPRMLRQNSALETLLLPQNHTPMIEVALPSYEIERNKPMPSFNHGRIQARLIMSLGYRYQKQFEIVSELSLDLADWPCVPDVCIYSKRPLDLRNDVIAMEEPPITAIEIISPSQSLSDLTTKAALYFEHGVKSCWVVLLPVANIYVYSGPDEYEIYRAHETLRDPATGIEIPLSEVFS